MGSLGELYVKIKSDTKNFRKGMNEAKSSMNSLSQKSLEFGKLLKGAFLVSAGIVALKKIAEGMKTIVSEGIRFNASMQSINASFTTMLGSAEKAKRMMEDLMGFAERTPFEMEGLAKSAKTLMAFGVEANKVLPIMKMLGDVSQGNQERFASLSLAFGQIQANGRLMGQDLLQLINAGFNPLKTISEKTGRSMAELKDEMSKGAISADMVTKAFIDATSKGGRFYNEMQKQSKTFDGLMSTLRDNTKRIYGQIMKPLFDYLATNVLPKLITLSKKFLSGLKEHGLKGALKEIFPKEIFDIINDMAKSIKVVFGLLRNTYTFISSFVQKHSEAFHTVFSLFAKFVRIVIESVNPVTYFTTKLEFLKATATKLKTVFINAWSNIKIVALQSIADIISSIERLLSAFPMLQSQLGSLRHHFENLIDEEETKKKTRSFVDAYNSLSGIDNIYRIVAAGAEQTTKKEQELTDSLGELKKANYENLYAMEKQKAGMEDLKKTTEDYANKVEELRQKTVDAYNKLGDAVITALKNKYSKEEEIQKESLNKQIDELKNKAEKDIEILSNAYDKKIDMAIKSRDKIVNNLQKEVDNVRKASDAKIAEYNREYKEKLKLINEEEYRRVKAIEQQIDNIKKQTEKENKEIEKREYEKRLAEKKAELERETDTEKRAKIQEKINEMIAQRERELLLERRQTQVDTLRAEIEKIRENADIKAEQLKAEFEQKKQMEIEERDRLVSKLKEEIELKKENFKQEIELLKERKQKILEMVENTSNAKQNLLKQDIDALKEHYKELTKEESLQAEARKLLLDNNNKELVDLLKSYNPKWRDAGKSFGEKMLEGLKEMKKPIQDTIAEMMTMISNARATLQLSASARVNIPRMAEGGIVTQPTIAMIGEAGPEAVIPLSNIDNSNKSNITININNPTIANTFDIDVIGEQLVKRLRMAGVV